MRSGLLPAVAAGLLLPLTAGLLAAGVDRHAGRIWPEFPVTPPPGYRDWRLVTVAREEGSLDDLRGVLGNDVAIAAYREGVRPFPDGTVIARLAWAHVPLADSERAFGQAQSFVAGAPKNGVQFMIKDARKFAATGGWGYAQFEDGKPAPGIVPDRCFACHRIAEDRDFVFSTYAP